MKGRGVWVLMLQYVCGRLGNTHRTDAVGSVQRNLQLAALTMLKHRTAMKEPTRTPMDNYAEFLQRLDAATESLKQRHDALLRVRAVLSSVLFDNQSGYQQWADRQTRVKGLLGGPEPAGRPGLKDLHAAAVNMESVFRARSTNVEGRLAAVQA